MLSTLARTEPGTPLADVAGTFLTKLMKPRNLLDDTKLGYEAGIKALLTAWLADDNVDTDIACYCYNDGTCGTARVSPVRTDGNSRLQRQQHWRGRFNRTQPSSNHDLRGNGRLRDGGQLREDHGRKLESALGWPNKPNQTERIDDSRDVRIHRRTWCSSAVWSRWK